MPIECRSWNFQASVGAMTSWERSTPRLPVAAEQVVRARRGIEPGARPGRRAAAAGRGELAAGVVGVHPAVAVHGQSEREIRAQHVVEPELRDEEVGAPAVGRTVEPERRPARTLGAAVRAEPVEADRPLVAGEGHRRRVVGATEGVLGDRGGHPAHALRLHPVAVREIAVGRRGGERQCGGGERRDAFESHVSSLDPDMCTARRRPGVAPRPAVPNKSVFSNVCQLARIDPGRRKNFLMRPAAKLNPAPRVRQYV